MRQDRCRQGQARSWRHGGRRRLWCGMVLSGDQWRLGTELWACGLGGLRQQYNSCGRIFARRATLCAQCGSLTTRAA